MTDNEKTLKQEIAALHHELRRVMDGIERNRTRELELRAARLRDSIALCERDLRHHARALQSPANKPY